MLVGHRATDSFKLPAQRSYRSQVYISGSCGERFIHKILVEVIIISVSFILFDVVTIRGFLLLFDVINECNIRNKGFIAWSLKSE